MTTRATKRRRPTLEALEGRALLAAGALDTTFGGTGMVTTLVSNHTSPDGAAPGASTGVAVQADLKTVVVGSVALYYNAAWHTGLAVARYNPDGSLDSSFGSGGVVDIRADSFASLGMPHAYSVALQADGKIVVAGDTMVTYGYVKSKGVTTPIQRDDILVVRLNSNGSFDTTFNGNGESVIDFPQGNEQSEGVAIQANGDIVVGGRTPVVSPANTPYPILVVRLTPSGALDHTFGPNGQGYYGKTTGGAYSMALDPSGDILIGGRDTNPATGGQNQAVIRLTPNGLPDPTFGSNGETFLSPQYYGISGIGFQSTGQIVVCGDMLNQPGGRMGLARLNANGSLDTTFGSGGYVYDAGTTGMIWTNDLAVQPDDKIVVTGENYASAVNNNGNQFQIDRFLANGQSLDPAFGAGGQVITGFPSATNQKGQAVVIGPDGKITYTGFAFYNSSPGAESEFAVARFLNDIRSSQPPAPAPTAAPLAPAPSPTLVPLVLDSPDLWDAFRPLTQRRGAR